MERPSTDASAGFSARARRGSAVHGNHPASATVLSAAWFRSRRSAARCPARGAAWCACGSGHASPPRRLEQELLAAKRDLCLPRTLRRYDNHDVVILDDLGYVQQSPEEAEVLFTLLSERYERRSLVLTSNLVFSQWERIFKNPMTTTAAAIDRLVHHVVVLEFVEMKSFRSEQATAARGRDNHDNHDNNGKKERGDNHDNNGKETVIEDRQ